MTKYVPVQLVGPPAALPRTPRKHRHFIRSSHSRVRAPDAEVYTTTDRQYTSKMAALGSVLGTRVNSSAPVFLRGTALKRNVVPAAARPSRSAAVTTPMAFFGMGGGPKQVDGQPMLCIDCGYIYRGSDFNSLPKDWECPPCGSGKNRFKPQPASGMAYADMAAAKKANKAAMAAKKKGGPR